MFCPSCGANVPDQSRFCPGCSANLAGAQGPAAPPPGYSAPTQGYGQGPAQQYGPPPQQYGQAPPTGGYPPPVAAGGLADNMAGLLAYITIIPAILFLVLDPYKRSPFVRFHAWQSIFMGIAAIAINVGLSMFMAFLPHTLGMMGIVGLLSMAVGLAFFVAWIMCLIKAYGNERFKLPVIGDFAEQQAMKG